MKQWLSIKEYADKVGQTRQYIYLLVRLGKIKSRIVQKKVSQMEVLYSDFKRSKEAECLEFEGYKDLLPDSKGIINKALKQ